MHSVFSTFLYVFSARDLGVVINSGLTTSDHVTLIICMLNFDSETLCLTLTELYKHYYNITSLLLTLKGPKGPTLAHFPSQGAAAPPCPSPKSATASATDLWTHDKINSHYFKIFSLLSTDFVCT